MILSHVCTSLVLAALAGAPASPASPPPADPLAAVAVESEIACKVGDFELSGTLALPPKDKGGGPFPAVLFVPGGADETFDRDGSFFGIKLFRQLAQRLAAHGVASLRYDRRALGKSKGDVGRATLADFSADARAMLACLRGRPEIAPQAVAMTAHGVGVAILLGAVADAKAGDKPPAGAILLAGSALPAYEASLENYRYFVEDRPNTKPADREEAIATRKRILDTVRAGGGLGKFSPAVIAQVETPYFKSLMTFDPAPLLRRLKAPVLIVHGEKDRQVAPANAKKLKDSLTRAGNKNVTLVLDPYINHLLMIAETGSVNEYPALGAKADPETMERVAAWAATTLKARK